MFQTICATQDIAFEGVIIMFIMTSCNLTISLRLINEEFDLKGKRRRRNLMYVLGFLTFILYFSLNCYFWNSSPFEAPIMLGFFLLQDIVNTAVLCRCNTVMRRLNMPLCSKESMRINIEFGIIIAASFSCSFVHFLSYKGLVPNEWM